MATISPQDSNAQSPALDPSPSSSLQAEYDAAVTAHKQQFTLMGPIRREYDELFLQHKQIQARHDNLQAKLKSHRSTYQRHKQYVASLPGALFASNTALHSTPKPFSDVQALTHATFLYELRTASHTLTNMIVQNKRLDNAADRSFTLDQEFYAKCRELFKVVDKDCRELDRLHMKVLEAGKKIGSKPECRSAGKKCVSCTRVQEREARRVAADKAQKAESRKVKGGMGKAAEGKQRLEDILEEGESEDRASAWM